MKKLLSFCLVSLGLALLAIPSSWATTYGDGNTDIRIGYEDKNCISNTEWTLLYNNGSLSKVTGIKGDLWAHHNDRKFPRRIECEGPLDPSANKEGVYYWKYDDATDTAECQFQGKIGTYSLSFLVTVTVAFKQEGKAVYAKVTKACYPYGSPYGTDTTSMSDGNKYVNDLSTLDKAHNRGHGSTSLHNVYLEFAAEGETRMVTFIGFNGETLDEVEVEYGAAATAPDVPEIDDYTFIEWDTDFSCVKDDLTVKAVYEPSYYTVTFLGKDGETVIEEKKVPRETDVEPPDAPSVDGFEFYGWDGDLTNVTEDRKITALYHQLFKVTFLGLNDKELLVTNVAETCSAIAPEPPEEEGYVFYEWDGSYENISGETTIKAIYHHLFTVVFKDTDGTELSKQTVEETCAATEPDMDGKENFLGWDTEFDCVMDNLTVTAVYGEKAAEVTIADETGLLTDEANALIFCGGTLDSAAWNGTTKNWATVKGVYTTWKSGATAVFAKDATVTLDEAQTVGKVIVLGEATSVTLSGEALTFADAATVQFNAEAVLKCENNLAGTAGLVVTGDVNSASAALEIAGNYGITGTLTVARAFFKTVGEGTLAGGTFSQAIAIKENGVVSLGSTASQTMKGQVAVAKKGEGYLITEQGSKVNFCSNIGSSWELRIAGEAEASGYNTLPGGGGKTHVVNGGVLTMGSFYGSGYWGPQVRDNVDGLTVEEGGLVYLTKQESAGILMAFLVKGGRVVNNYARYDTKKNLLPTDMLLYKWRFQDGGELAGNAMVAGVTDYRGGDVYPGSFIEALGTKPSYVRLDEIRLGYSTSGSKSAPVDLRFVVADVTGDDESDLYIESPITETAGMTYDVRTSVGLCKQGAGTLELSATNSSCTTGVFKVEAGTVRFPAKSGGSFGALQVTGDTVIDVAASARVSFDNSSEIAWTSGKKLIFTGDMTGKSVRIGTDANALTEDQLKQVVYRKASGKEVSMSLNAEGYLQPPAKSLTIIIQ